MKNFYLFIGAIILIASNIMGQEVDIVPSLKAIERGNIKFAKESLNKLQSENPNNPDVKFLKAVLSNNGEVAITLYKDIVENFPKSNYADAAQYRIFSYYFAKGLYSKAEKSLEKLKKDYPDSPYLKVADRTIPEDEIDSFDTNVKVELKKDKAVEKKDLFYVQAGAFLNSQNAAKLKNKILRDGYFAEVVTKEISGSLFNLVRAGKFYNREDASKFISYLKEKYNLIGRVIKSNED